MTKTRDMVRLAEVAQLMLDQRLGQLRTAAEAVERSRMQLSAINEAAKPADLPPVAAEKVGLGYERWADVRRAELNLVIARQTAAWIDARGDAGTAFGRLQALQGLTRRLEERR
jgi:hypothetical protein